MNLKNNFNKFLFIWFGQFISTMGSAMTGFAVLLWVYEQKSTASSTALLSFFWIFPFILFSPLAGVMADRYNRKVLIILSDLLVGTSTLMMLVLYRTHHLEIWHLYLAQSLAGAFGAFQAPAFTSSIGSMLGKEHFERASGLSSFSDAFSKVMAPILASLILVKWTLSTIMMIDLLTCIFAVSTLLMLKLPQARIKKVQSAHISKMWEDFFVSLRYFKGKLGLFILLLFFFSINLIASITYFGILSPMILARSGGDKMILASVQALLGIGGVVGSLIVSIWGCPKNKVKTIIITTFLSFLGGDVLFSLGRNAIIWGIGAFLSAVFIPFLVAGNYAIWLSKVHPSMQGRIFALRGMLVQSAMPIGYIAGGFLADYFFEPLMADHSLFHHLLTPLVGSGPGSGMAVMFLISAILGCGSCVAAYLFHSFRHLDTIIPDHEEIKQAS